MEIFWVSYQMPKFGTENKYEPTVYHFGVETDGGEKDALVACSKYHKNCKILSVEPAKSTPLCKNRRRKVSGNERSK